VVDNALTVRLVATVLLAASCGFSAHNTAVDAAPDAPPCFENRCRRKTITIDHTKVAGSLAQFPLYFTITDLALDDRIAFVEATSERALAYERERWAPGTGELVAWVALPSLASDKDTTLYLYYGDPLAADTEQRTGVWDPQYAAVWHLAEELGGPGAIRDATTNGNTGTDAGTPVLNALGKVGRAIRFDGGNDSISVAPSASLDAIAARGSLEMWVNFDVARGTDYQRLLMGGNSLAPDNTGTEWATNSLGDYYYYPADAGGYNYASVAIPFVDGQWHHIAVTQDYATKTVQMFVDGKLQSSSYNSTLWVHTATSTTWYWGGRPPSSTKFAGMMDEIRVSTTVRAPEWFATQYANQRDPATFYTVK
jgi:biopolymer transport protein ExbB